MSRYTEWLDACNHGWKYRNCDDGISEIHSHTQTLASTEDPETALQAVVEQVLYEHDQRSEFTYYTVVGWIQGRGPLIGGYRTLAIDWEERVLELGLTIDWHGDKHYPDPRGQVLRLIDSYAPKYVLEDQP